MINSVTFFLLFFLLGNVAAGGSPIPRLPHSIQLQETYNLSPRRYSLPRHSLKSSNIQQTVAPVTPLPIAVIPRARQDVRLSDLKEALSSRISKEELTKLYLNLGRILGVQSQGVTPVPVSHRSIEITSNVSPRLRFAPGLKFEDLAPPPLKMAVIRSPDVQTTAFEPFRREQSSVVAQLRHKLQETLSLQSPKIPQIDSSVFSHIVLPRQLPTLAPTTTTTTTTTSRPSTTSTTKKPPRKRPERRRRKKNKSPESQTRSRSETSRADKSSSDESKSKPTVEFSIDELKELLLATSKQGIDRSELVKIAYGRYSPLPPPLPVYPEYYDDYGPDYDSVTLGRPPKRSPAKARKSYRKSPKSGQAGVKSSKSIHKQLEELSAILTPAPRAYDDLYGDYGFYPISPKKYNDKLSTEVSSKNQPPNPFITTDSRLANQIAGNLLSRKGYPTQRSNYEEVDNAFSGLNVLNSLKSLFQTIFSAANKPEVGPQLKDIPQPTPFDVNGFGFRRYLRR